MRIIFCLLFICSINAQPFNLFFDDDREWRPTDVAGTVYAYYDGDLGLTTSTWEDQYSTNDITLANAPTLVTGATSKKNGIRFNGTDENGVTATPNVGTVTTYYIVFKSITWADTDRIFDDAATDDIRICWQRTASPNLGIRASNELATDPDAAVGTYFVLTAKFKPNLQTSELRVNLNAATTATNLVSGTGAGITLASRVNNTAYGNIEVVYLVIRGDDNTATQDIIIGKLGDICGITF